MPRNDSIDSFLSSRSVIKYPNPFFDLAKNYLPKQIKTLFKYCRTFYYTNDFIKNVINKLTRYPITNILFEDNTDQELEEIYRAYFDRHLKLKDFLIGIGLDYFTYGNSFISAHLKFKRNLQCPTCEVLYPIGDIPYKFKKGQFTAVCKSKECNAQEIVMDIVDVEIKNVNGMKFTRWNPENIEIDYDEITGDCEYYYIIPTATKKQVHNGNPSKLEKLPKVFLDAILKNRKPKLDKNNLYHFKAPTLAENDQGWGKPDILPAMKKMHYMATLMRGNEAIANEHIVPKKTLFPSSNGNFDLHNMSMVKWKAEAEDAIKKWKVDPNHIAIFPIPMGYQELGGTGRSLLLTPELKFLEETIINGLGVPLEFVKGGASWTGSSVSLRIIENHFLNYRERMLDFINYFLVAKLNEFLGFKKVKIKFTKIRMSDDSEAKNLAIQLNSQNKLSDRTLLDEFGYDSDEEKERIKDEADFRREIMVNDALAQATAQGEAQLILAKMQVIAEQEASEEVNRTEERMFSDELQNELGIDDESIHEEIKKLASTIMMLSTPAEQISALKALHSDSPMTYNMVIARIQKIQAEADAAELEAEQNELDRDSKVLQQKQQAQAIAEGVSEKQTGAKNVRTRNEDKTGPKRDANTGKAKV